MMHGVVYAGKQSAFPKYPSADGDPSKSSTGRLQRRQQQQQLISLAAVLPYLRVIVFANFNFAGVSFLLQAFDDGHSNPPVSLIFVLSRYVILLSSTHAALVECIG